MEPDIKEEEIELDEFSLEDTKAIITILKILPLKLFKKESEIYKQELEKGELISINKTIEYDVKRKVATETEEKEVKGEMKTVKKFSNEMARDSQSLSILSNRKDYQSNKEKIDTIDKEINSAKIALSYMKRILRSAEALIYAGK